MQYEEHSPCGTKTGSRICHSAHPFESPRPHNVVVTPKLVWDKIFLDPSIVPAVLELRNTHSGTEVEHKSFRHYPRNDALLIDKKRLPLFEQICEREKCGCAVVGEVKPTGQVVVFHEDKKIVDLPLEKVLGKMPQKTFEMKTTPPRISPAPAGSINRLDAELRGPRLLEVLYKVLRLPAVASKRFLTNKVDRSVSGLVAQQQCVGRLHTPLADCAVVAHSPYGFTGAAVSVGEQPIVGLSGTSADLALQGKLTVCEAVLNLAGVQLGKSGLANIRASCNWMWPAKFPGEGAKMYEVCKAVSDTVDQFGFAIDGGKDSLSMATRMPENAGGEVVKCPGEVVLTCYASVPDVRKKITSDFKKAGSSIIVVDAAATKNQEQFGGFRSSLAQVAGPDYETELLCSSSNSKGVCENLVEHVKAIFDTVQTPAVFERILAVHDVSDGGLLVNILEMCFAGNFGARLTLHRKNLFQELPGLIIEVPMSTSSGQR